MKIGQIVKHKLTGDLYEVVAILGSVIGCVRLSAYDGMPMGDIIQLDMDEVE